MKKSITLSSIAIASLLLVGCGGGGANSSSSTVGTGYYVDSAVQGVNYVCGSQTGVTDIDGKFTFEQNQKCSFKVGNVILREVNASTLKHGISILEDDADTARFLQTLDRDGNASNGIEVSDAVKNLNLTEVPKDDALLSNIRDDIKANDDKYQGRVVTLLETQEHLRQTRTELEDNNRDTQYTNGSIEQTKAYFGDKVNNVVVVVDVENMKVLEKIATGHSITYAAETIKTEVNGINSKQKFYIDNRGSNAIDVLDGTTNTITKTIDLTFYPRSIDVRKNTGLAVVSGKNKTMASVIDTTTDTVLLTVGDSNLTTSTGHPKWLNDTHFALVDREHQAILTYKIAKDTTNGTWSATLVNKLVTPSPVHNLIPPEVHGQHGNEHNTQAGQITSTIFYATAEGTNTVNGAVLKLEFLENIGLSQLEELEIAPVSGSNLTASNTGVHHHNFLADQKTIYVGSKEGTLSIIDYSTTPMRIIKTVTAGKGAGHTAELKHKNIAIVINHTDKFVTLMDTLTHSKIADIPVSNIPDSDVGIVQTQSHPEYHFSKDGRYFYLFLTEEGALVKIDLTTKSVIQRLEIGGHLSMGSFVSSKDTTKHSSNHSQEH